MSDMTDLSLEFHQQDSKVLCGAACAQMGLLQLGAILFDQHDLYDKIQDFSSTAEKDENWWSGPTGLWKTMDDLNPVPDIHNFGLYAEQKENIISRKIIWSIFQFKIAPFALVYSGQHWVVINGYQTTSAVKSIDDISYAILGFFVSNPWPSTPLPHPPPHFTGDICGTGSGFGIANHHISYSTWKRHYMTYNRVGSFWNGKFIAVCDADPLPKNTLKQLPEEFLNGGDKMMDKETAGIYAEKALFDYGLTKYSFLRDILNKVKPGNPVLVQRFDRTNDFYFLVPMETPDKSTHSLVCVDGRFGNYREAAFSKDKDNPLVFEPLNRDQILKLMGNRIQIDQKGTLLIIHPEAVVISPVMVWMPCLESFSPFLPFYMVIIGNTRIFVRIDGQIFNELTTNFGGA
jgi:hypothetical protein